jgi:lipopolysaccharide/colanic/teichoic acid biosynthesis glycosyltransferase
MKRQMSQLDKAEMIQPLHAWYVPIKSLLDFVLGLTLLVLFSPIILISALLVRLTSKGPAFYLQTRVGKDGRPFLIIKLRSMCQNAEAETGAVWCREEDDRVTPLGKILRATHLDEFPQLINVVMGDMSLVGPRPERPEFVHKFELQIDGYATRLSVRPGITGIAQLRLPADTDLDSVRRKLEFDQYYVRHVNPLLDGIALVTTAVNFLSTLAIWIIPPALKVPTHEKVAAEARRRSASVPKEPARHLEPVLVSRTETPMANSAPAT